MPAEIPRAQGQQCGITVSYSSTQFSYSIPCTTRIRCADPGKFFSIIRTNLQSFVRQYQCKKEYLQLRASAIYFQALVRGRESRVLFTRMKAAKRIQAVVR